MHTLLDLAFENPGVYVCIVGAVILSIVLHELGHALTATWEGDPTPKIRGHLTWNPVVHMGWISILLVAVMGIGWGLTPVTPRFFRHRRWGEALVSFAGPAVNIALALVGAVVALLMERSGAHVETPLVYVFWRMLLEFNVLLFLFNLIPLPPLDGFGVLAGTFDLGDFGARLRALGIFPLLAAMLIVRSDAFDVVVDAVSGGIIAAASVLTGTV